jgi:hypothetical protein
MTRDAGLGAHEAGPAYDVQQDSARSGLVSRAAGWLLLGIGRLVVSGTSPVMAVAVAVLGFLALEGLIAGAWTLAARRETAARRAGRSPRWRARAVVRMLPEESRAQTRLRPSSAALGWLVRQKDAWAWEPMSGSARMGLKAAPWPAQWQLVSIRRVWGIGDLGWATFRGPDDVTAPLFVRRVFDLASVAGVPVARGRR